MRKALIFVGLAAVFGSPVQANDQAIAAGKALLERDLIDAGSVQYRDVRAYAAGENWIVCGEVNAKNRFGGYIGFKRFYASGGSAAVDQPDERTFQIMFNALCSKWPN